MRSDDHLLGRAHSEDGGMTAFGIFLLLVTLMIGGLGLDVTNAIRERTHLQVAADSAAHAALVVRETRSASEAKAVALDVADAAMPAAFFGDVLRNEDIQFGNWDPVAQAFQVDSSSNSAVLINMERVAGRNNAVSTFFLKFAGIGSWDVRRQSVFETYIPTCFREGFVAQQEVDVTTGNTYKAGFCIHSQTHVAANNGNTYEPGVIVSMPDKRDMVIPSDGFTTNPGLQAALRDGSYQLRIVSRINEIVAGVQDPNSPHYRSYITSATPVVMDPKSTIDAQWVEGRIHTLDCTKPNQKVQAKSGSVQRRGVLVTNCLLQFPEAVTFEDAVIASTNTDAKSIDAAQFFTLGKDDSCASSGDGQIVTLGGVAFAQSVSFYGGQVIAAKDIDFTSDALGVEGISLVSGQRIYGTSTSLIGFCGGAGMENNFVAWYFRMAA